MDGGKDTSRDGHGLLVVATIGTVALGPAFGLGGGAGVGIDGINPHKF